MEIKDYWLIIRERWMVVLLALLVAMGVAAAVTATTTPLYASTSKLYVSTQSADANTAFQGGQFASQQMASYAEVARYDSTAEQVSSALGGTPPPEELVEAVEAQVSPDTVNLNISVVDPDPVAARDAAQAYAQVMVERIESFDTLDSRTESLVKASIADPAQIDTSAVSPQPLRNIGLGAVLGLLLGVGIAVARDLFDTSISSSEDVRAITPTPILGHINADGAAVKKEPVAALREPTPWSEAFRVLRTNMQFVEVDHDHRMFVVSSALPGEGKSTTTVNLAITLAMAGQKVALVDCDLRRPMLANRLGIDGDVGTTSVLIGQVKLDDALQQLGDTEVEVLACGPVPPNPSELLQSHAMSELVAELRRRFDVVLIDAPPLLPVTDSALLASQTDGLLLVTRHGKTTRDQLEGALNRVTTVGGKTVGVVINMAPARKAGSGYGYGYGYGYATTDGAEPSTRAMRKERKAAARAAARARA